ncbi:hypothetical protein QCB44_09920 [Thiomicrorhabdus sp. zzn3]|uniref:hypothetical protein n=1 Tax=Thiomicrorhabdus sp. zzn3 TaxID=3039775 RepID=UPI0024364ECD|nr:hypothetical protein [Thiomicrorhabdus sp. zzn3]MDG6779023.1 hypothetical protein [Thiomicrorhabdus sp. zzn3]
MSDLPGKGLYLPSTPLNVLVSAALALNTRQAHGENQQAELWLIDQRNQENNPYFNALQQWSQSPFSGVRLFGTGDGVQSKWKVRRQLFVKLDKALENYDPDFVAVGSDRRIEFQYVMHRLHQRAKQPTGVYMDDGLYSYAGRPSVWWKDLVNAGLKKMVYGSWWEEPSTVGASSLIDQAWLFRPHSAVAALKAKACFELPGAWFTQDAMLELSRRVAEEMGFDLGLLAGLDDVILIAHPHNIEKMPGYRERMADLVQRLVQQGQRVGIKYHPRSGSEDVLHLLGAGAEVVIPSQLAFEFCLPAFTSQGRIIGDVGTALFTGRWLRPDMDVIAWLNPQDAFQKRFVDLSRNMGVTVLERIETL